MKNWIDKLQDKDIQDILNKPQVLKKMPKHLDNNLRQKIYSLMQKKTQKRVPLVLRFSLAALILVFLSLPIFIYLYFNLAPGGLRIESIYGQVEISRNERNIPLKAGDAVEPDDIIITGQDAYCRIQIDQESVITLEHNTRIKLNQLQLEQKFTEIDLIAGDISIEISKKSQLSVKTPTATIIGAHFRVSYNTKMESTLIAGMQESVYVEYRNKDNKIEEFIINPRESMELVDKDTSPETEEKETEPEIKMAVWKARQIWQAEEQILGFAQGAGKIIAQTGTELVCFTSNYKKIWSKSYSTEQGIAFMSIPLISKGKVICSSVNKLIIILNLETGEEVKRIPASGNINFGNKMIEYQGKIYLPFATGIYTMDISTLNSEPELEIAFNNPTTPIINHNIIYLASFVTNRVAAFSLQGQELWSFDREHRSYSSPVLIDEYLYAADSKSNLYKLSLAGELLDKIKINQSITSCLKAVAEKLFVMADDGLLYQIDLAQFKIDQTYAMDQQPNPEVYIYKSPHIIDDKLFIGTDRGTINIIDLIDPQLSKKLNISKSPISCTLQNMNSNFFIGCQNGEIHVILHE